MSDVKVIYKPTVRLVGRQTIDEDALNVFLADEGADTWTTDTDISSQKLVELGGRLCYQSYSKPRPGGNSTYIGHLLEVGHGSVIEAAVFSFIITGISRSCSHELVRHRAGMSYSQRSQRFCNEGELSVVVPPALIGEVNNARAWLLDQGRDADDARNALENISNGIWGPDEGVYAGLLWLAHMEQSQEYYSGLSGYLASKDGINLPGGGKTETTLRRKQSREAARSVLPNATATEIFVTANARALRNMFEQRGSIDADAEFRRLAVAMLRIMKVEAPNLFPDFTVETTDGGVEYLTCKYHKV